MGWGECDEFRRRDGKGFLRRTSCVDSYIARPRISETGDAAERNLGSRVVRLHSVSNNSRYAVDIDIERRVAL